MVKPGPDDYPLTDDDGYHWFNPITFKGGPGPCFVCGQSTERIDVCFEAYFCDSPGCNKYVDDTLAATA